MKEAEFSAYLEVFLRQHHAALMREATSLMGPAALATHAPEDILQQAYQYAFQNPAKFEIGERGDVSTKAWFLRVIHNMIRQIARSNLGSRRKPKGGLERLEADLLQLPDDGETPSRLAGKAEALRFLRDEVAKLREDWKVAIVHFYCEGLTVPEIADHLGKSATAVEGLLKRARKALRGKMGGSSLYFHSPR